MLIDHLRWWRKVQGVRLKVGFIRKLEDRSVLWTSLEVGGKESLFISLRFVASNL